MALLTKFAAEKTSLITSTSFKTQANTEQEQGLRASILELFGRLTQRVLQLGDPGSQATLGRGSVLANARELVLQLLRGLARVLTQLIQA
jgi:hypothetical protein